MYADAIVAAILQAEMLDTPMKHTSSNAKIDRAHFKECTVDMLQDMFGEGSVSKVTKGECLDRLLFGWLLPPKPAFLKFTTTPGVRAYTFTKQVFQDIVLPINKLEDQINISEELFDCYPLLVYPCRVYDHGEHWGQLKRPTDLVPGEKFAMYNDLGIYGVPGHVVKKKEYKPVEAMRTMEKFTRDVGGFSFLYADIFMTREELEEMFDLTLYEVVRKKYYAADAFPHLYDKVKPEIDVLNMG